MTLRSIILPSLERSRSLRGGFLILEFQLITERVFHGLAEASSMARSSNMLEMLFARDGFHAGVCHAHFISESTGTIWLRRP
jgi:hypothetical protein